MFWLFVLFLFFVIEEVWSWWKDGLVYIFFWLIIDEIFVIGDVDFMSDVLVVLVELCGVKLIYKVLMCILIFLVCISVLVLVIVNFKVVEFDLVKVFKIEFLMFFVEGDELILEVELGEFLVKCKK